MDVRRFLFMRRQGKVSFWELSGEMLCPCTIQQERSVDEVGFWDRWKDVFRLEDSDQRDLLLLSDEMLSLDCVPAWFREHGVSPSAWTGRRLESFFSREREFAGKTVFVEMSGATSMVWNGGGANDRVLLHGVSTSDLGLPEVAQSEPSNAQLKMEHFLLSAEKHTAENAQRCASRR